ncbi:MAG: MmcQ/YjbR family DNA-binding protein [Bacteroidota bacterium]
MNIEEFRDFCLSFPATTEDMPFDNKVLTFKVLGKIFALTDIDAFDSINLKCDPEVAEELRAKYPSVQPGYHMNKKHWNTIILDGELDDRQLRHWIRHSYEKVVAGMPKKDREALKEANQS